jgi:hypothetical protein
MMSYAQALKGTMKSETRRDETIADRSYFMFTEELLLTCFVSEGFTY